MKKGFTLIELLVVVLILGILAAVALPQYETAVARSRYQQSVIFGTKIAQANDVYFLANGQYATDFSQLDLDFGEGAGEINEDGGTYNIIRLKDSACTLRTYAPGTVQCNSRSSGVPEFTMKSGTNKRACVAYFDKGEVARRICKIETDTTAPSATSAKYETYSY